MLFVIFHPVDTFFFLKWENISNCCSSYVILSNYSYVISHSFYSLSLSYLLIQLFLCLLGCIVLINSYVYVYVLYILCYGFNFYVFKAMIDMQV